METPASVKLGTMPGEPIRIEDHVRMFHAECGGIVVGVLGEPLRCAECGAVMEAFVSDFDGVTLRKRQNGLYLVRPLDAQD